jgi:CheY-like chemotaxis protein
MPDKPRILLVDDEPFILSMMRSFLDENKFEISTASCGNDAIALIRKQPFDCVVSDVRMPNGTGFQLLGWLREIDSARPTVIFVTGYSDIPADELMAKGADTYISKPFNVEDFANEIALMTKPLRVRLSRSAATTAQTRHIKLQASSFAALTAGGGQAKLGRGGVFVQMPIENIRVSQQVSFEINLGEGETFQGTGKVLWTRKTSSLNPMRPGIGILFETLTPDSLDAFIQFVETKAPIEVIPRDC